ncbi:MAG TPA: flagellar biosynthetic protein FliO [Pirellulales bacterium]|jgi:flagellar biogenesis protein FliO|nr:flagellar biosynthetic protein FliO [Pirellulales bacterium]
MPTRAIILFTAFFLASSLADAAPRRSAADSKQEATASEGQRSDVRQAVHTTSVADRAAPVEPNTQSARHGPARALTPRGEKPSSNGEPHAGARPISGASSFLTGLASLAIVLGLFFVAAWVMRRGLAAGAAPLPSQVVEVLGRTALVGRQHAHLVRCGNKLLLVFLAPGVAETLTEITDAGEVERLAGLCRQARLPAAGASFRQIFQQIGGEKITTGWLSRRAAPHAAGAAREENDA